MTNIHITTTQQPANAQLRSTPQALQLRADVAAILAGIPNVARCVDALDYTIFRLIERRAAQARGDESVYADPCEAPLLSPLPRRERERIVPLLDAAIDASGLDAYAAEDALYAPLFDIEKGRRAHS